MLVQLRFLLVLAGWLSLWQTGQAQPFLRQVEKAEPAERIRLILNHFDTCQVVITQRATAFLLLDQLTALAQQQNDEQLGAYSQFLRDTYAKNDPKRSFSQKAGLFLHVAEQLEHLPDQSLAAVARHFAGMYYFLDEEYSKAFPQLLTANQAFRSIGYERIPVISRYLYDLALTYYYLNEYNRVVALLNETTKYPPFSANLHIQTYNTLGMAYRRIANNRDKRMIGLAEQSLRKAEQLAQTYRDSLWIGYVYGNLGNLYSGQQQWQAALKAYRFDYQLGLKFGKGRGYPNNTACYIADVFLHLKQLDSCRYYLDQSALLYEKNGGVFHKSVVQADDIYRQHYYDVKRQYSEATGNLPNAYHFADSVLIYQQRIDKRASTKAAILAEQRLMVQQHQDELEQLEQDNTRQRWLLAAGVGMAALLALLLGFLYRSSLRKRQREALANSEREKRLAVEKQQVSEERDRARADLSQFMETLRQKEALLDQFRILTSPSAPATAPGESTSLQQTNLLTNGDWEQFRQRFERVHPLFFEQLRHQFADLTPAEERLLALSKLNIDSLRMSQMLGISQESIRKSKYRIRKKLGLNGSSPLSELLR